MKTVRRSSKLLLWIHLFVCLVWLYLFQATAQPPAWMIHVFIWSVLAIQFTWGFTVGLIVGPSRRRRQWLWASLLTIFMPLYFVGALLRAIFAMMGPLYALVYLTAFTAILGCETFGGVMLGARIHGQCRDDWD